MNIIPFNLYGVYNGGLNTRDDPRALPLHKSPYLRNVELRRNRVDRTPGYTTHSGTDADTAANLGLFVATKGPDTWLLKAEGGKIKKLKVVGSSADAAWVTLKTGLSASAKMEFTQANNVVYCTNGTDTVQKWDLATTPASTSDCANIPKGTTIAYFKQRLLVNDPTDPSKLRFSAIGDYENITTTGGYKYADQGEGGAILRILDTGRDQALIMKDNGRYLWDGVDTSTSNPKKYSSRGTRAPRSVVMMPTGEVAFCNHQAVWLANIFDYGERMISDEIDPTWDALNHGKMADAAGAYHGDQYILSVADGGASVNNICLVFDFQLDSNAGGWLFHDIGATAFAEYVDSSGVMQLIFGDPTAHSKVFRRYLGTTSSEFNFDGAAYTSVHESKEHDFHEIVPEAAGKQKAMVAMGVSAAQEGDYNLTIGWRKDNDADFTTALWNLKGTGTSTWSDTPTDVWGDGSDQTDLWEGQQKVEGTIPTFDQPMGRTFQQKVELTGTNQPFSFFGSTVHFIPLKGFN